MSFDLQRLLDNISDANFTAFIQESDETQLVPLSIKLKKTYNVAIHSKENVYLESKDLTPFEIVANLGLLPQARALLIDIDKKIDVFENKGTRLIADGFNNKGTRTQQIAQQIRKEINNLRIYMKDDQRDTHEKFLCHLDYKKQVAQNVGKIIYDGNKIMGDDRNWRDNVAHLCLALTGIGLFVMLANRLYSGQFFINNTERQCKLEDINQAATSIVRWPFENEAQRRGHIHIDFLTKPTGSNRSSLIKQIKNEWLHLPVESPSFV